MTGPANFAQVTGALHGLLELGKGRLNDEDLAEVHEVRARIDERLAKGDGLTVVAFAGGTGVGKSALLNRVVAAQVATEGVRRPTTDHPLAVTAELGPATEALLDWLDIADRRSVDTDLPAGLVLVDLPDHDSVVEQHRHTSAELAQRVDAVVVVVDPLKYARADLHRGPLAKLTAHTEVVTVVLNRVDEISDRDLEHCHADLKQQLATTGIGDVALFTTSAADGTGVDGFRTHLTELAARKAAAVQRVTGDSALLAHRILTSLPEAGDHQLATGDLLEAMLEVTDAHRTEVHAGATYRTDARAAVRSPLARIVHAPLAGVRKLGEQIRSGAPEPTATPRRSPQRLAQVLGEELHLHDTTGVTHASLGRTIEQTARDATPALADAVRRVSVHPPQRPWWTAVAWFRGAFELVMLAGLAWLILLGVADWLQLPEVPTPQVTDDLSLPAALFLSGLAARIVAGLVTRVCVALGAKRHSRRVFRTVRSQLEAAVHTHVLEPVEAEQRRYETLRGHLNRLVSAARSGGGAGTAG